MTIKCYDQTHLNYIGAAIIWLCVVTMGIPAFFIYLLKRFKVPELARLQADNAWLREAVELAWTEGVPQPSVKVSDINCDTIDDLHLESLFAFFCRDASVEEAAEILNGSRPPITEAAHTDAKGQPQEQTVLQAKVDAVKEKLMSAAARARSAQHRLRASLEQKCKPRRLSQPGVLGKEHFWRFSPSRNFGWISEARRDKP
jgi:hypothetical protein